MIGLLLIAFGFTALVAFAVLALRYGVDSRVDAIDAHRVDHRVAIS